MRQFCAECDDEKRCTIFPCRWIKSRPMTHDEMLAMEKATRDLDAEIEAELRRRRGSGTF